MTMPMILSHMGYNWNMPKAVVYALTSTGGWTWILTPQHQTRPSKITHMIKHLRMGTTLSTLMEAAIKAYQIQAGIPALVLKYTAPLPWTPQQWIANLQESLHSRIQGQIVLASPWIIPPLQHIDTHILLNFQNAGYNIEQLKILNNC